MKDSLVQAFSLDGRVAVVTGAGSGLGRETAVVLAEAGATPVLCDIDEAGLEETASLVEQADARPVIVRTDVADRSAVEAAADKAAALTGRVEIWVNVAGIIVNRPVIEAIDAEVNRMISVNLKGVYWGYTAAGRVMRHLRT